MQRKAVAVVALVLAVVYAGLLGMGAYLQYESGRLFDQMWTSEEGRALEAEYRQTARRSEAAEVVRRGIGIPGRGHRRMAGAGQTDESPGIRRFGGQRPDLGRAGHTALVAQKRRQRGRLLCAAALFGAGRHGGRRHRRAVPGRRGQTRAELTENDREKKGGFQQGKTAQYLRRHRALLCFQVAGRSGVPRSSRRCMTGRNRRPTSARWKGGETPKDL